MRPLKSSAKRRAILLSVMEKLFEVSTASARQKRRGFGRCRMPRTFHSNMSSLRKPTWARTE